MRINYYGYYLQHRDKDKKVLLDIRDILNCFCKYDDKKYKSKFSHLEENVYISHQVNDLYLFIMTRSHEIIKKVNTNNLSVNDIQELLEKNEKLGFASFILLKENYFSFGSTLLAPKFQVFGNFVNEILASLNITDYEFCIEPLLHQATKNEVVKMPFIGRTKIEIDIENSLAKDMINVFGCSGGDAEDIESFEITIKPKPKKSIKKVVDKLIDSVEDSGLQKMIVKAKDETHSQLTELYLTGQGAISDYVGNISEDKISGLLETKAASNKYLKNKLEELIQNEKFEEADINHILRFGNMASWSDIVSGL